MKLNVQQDKYTMALGSQTYLSVNLGPGFWGKTYDVSPYDSQRSHPSMNLGDKMDLCVLFVQTAVRCQDCKIV